MMIEPAFWSDGSVWIGQSDQTEESSALAEFALHELKVKDWCFFQTSGSEGRRKWVGLTKESLLISARAVNRHFDITERDHWLLALPIHHVGGFGVQARAFVSGSQMTTLEGKWHAAAFVQRCADVGATLASLVPTQVFDLVAAELCAPQSLRVVLVGGGAMSSEVEQAAKRLGWPVRRTYGMTETASQIASQTLEDSGEMEVLPIWDLRIDDEGVLTVRGEALAKGYASEEAGKWHWQPISAESGLRTRDRVELWTRCARRFLRFTGREAGAVKILGELVSLGAIQERSEALILQMGLYEGEAVVCDLPDARKEARLVLAVSGMSVTNAERLLASLNQELRAFEQVEQIMAVPMIPRSELGKVRLTELRAML